MASKSVARRTGWGAIVPVALALALVLALGITGCASPEPAAPGTDTPAAAEDQSLSKVMDSGKLVVGLAPFYPPFESTNEETKEIEGFDVDLMRALAAEMGVEVEFSPSEWQGLLGGLEKGDYDVLFTAMSKKEAAEANVEFSDVYYLLDDVILVANGNPEGIAGKADLKDKVIGIQSGSSAEQLADALQDELGFKEIKRYKLTQDAINDLKVGRVDAVFAGEAFAVEQSKVDDSFDVVGEPLESAELVGVFRKGSTALVAEFNKHLATLRSNGTYDALVEKWLTVK